MAGLLDPSPWDFGESRQGLLAAPSRAIGGLLDYAYNYSPQTHGMADGVGDLVKSLFSGPSVADRMMSEYRGGQAAMDAAGEDGLARIKALAAHQRSIPVADSVAMDLGGMLGSTAGKGPRSLPMDDASRLSRSKEMGYSDELFYRADGGKNSQGAAANPSEFPSGASFTRDPEYNAGGFGENKAFRLNLSRALMDENPVTAGTMARVIESARANDPKLAADLAGLFDKTPEWFVGFGRARPNDVVMDNSAMLRAAVENSAAPEKILIDAGIDAIGRGHEVRKISGSGIRRDTAAFDPAKWDLKDIYASLAGILGLGAMTNQDSRQE